MVPPPPPSPVSKLDRHNERQLADGRRGGGREEPIHTTARKPVLYKSFSAGYSLGIAMVNTVPYKLSLVSDCQSCRIYTYGMLDIPVKEKDWKMGTGLDFDAVLLIRKYLFLIWIRGSVILNQDPGDRIRILPGPFCGHWNNMLSNTVSKSFSIVNLRT